MRVKFPLGVDKLDLSFFEDRITIDRLAGCKSADDLSVICQEARWIVWLRQLKQLAEEE